MFFFFKQKTAYEMRISDWSSDVCSSDLTDQRLARLGRSQNVVIKTSASMMLELAELGLGYVVMTGCAMGSRRYEMEAVPIAELSVTWTIRSEERRVGKECVRTG